MAIFSMTHKSSPNAYLTIYNGEEIFMEKTHEGQVLAVLEVNSYDDSDFVAVVWDFETQAPKRVVFASTRAWSYPNHAKVDATPEVLEAYAAYKAAAHKVEMDRLYALAIHAHLRPSKGQMVRVFKGRKVPVGTQGEVFWSGFDHYGNPKVGIKVEDKKVYVAGGHVAVMEAMTFTNLQIAV